MMHRVYDQHGRVIDTLTKDSHLPLALRMDMKKMRARHSGILSRAEQREQVIRNAYADPECKAPWIAGEVFDAEHARTLTTRMQEVSDAFFMLGATLAVNWRSFISYSMRTFAAVYSLTMPGPTMAALAGVLFVAGYMIHDQTPVDRHEPQRLLEARTRDRSRRRDRRKAPTGRSTF